MQFLICLLFSLLSAEECLTKINKSNVECINAEITENTNLDGRSYRANVLVLYGSTDYYISNGWLYGKNINVQNLTLKISFGLEGNSAVFENDIIKYNDDTFLDTLNM